MSTNDSQKKKPAVVFTKSSPYMVYDLENFIGSRGEKLATKPVMALCRCGRSKNKPYCDGSHSKEGIDGEKKEDRVKDRVLHYKGENITIHDNRGVCSSDKSCINNLPAVFRKGKKRWIDPDGAGVEEIMATVKLCPSGALAYTAGDTTWTGSDREPAIKVAGNGPLEITGSIILKDGMGSIPQSAEHYTLCRCGGSKNKPFCDGSHFKTGYSDDKD